MKKIYSILLLCVLSLSMVGCSSDFWFWGLDGDFSIPQLEEWINEYKENKKSPTEAPGYYEEDAPDTEWEFIADKNSFLHTLTETYITIPSYLQYLPNASSTLHYLCSEKDDVIFLGTQTNSVTYEGETLDGDTTILVGSTWFTKDEIVRQIAKYTDETGPIVDLYCNSIVERLAEYSVYKDMKDFRPSFSSTGNPNYDNSRIMLMSCDDTNTFAVYFAEKGEHFILTTVHIQHPSYLGYTSYARPYCRLANSIIYEIHQTEFPQ